MGKAGGWLILGIAWIIDAETSRYNPKAGASLPVPTHRTNDTVDDDMLVFDSKGKGRSDSQPPQGRRSTVSTVYSEDSFDLATPEDDDALPSQHSGQGIRLLVSCSADNGILTSHSTIWSLHCCICIVTATSSSTTPLLCPRYRLLSFLKSCVLKATMRGVATSGHWDPSSPVRYSSWICCQAPTPISPRTSR